MHSAQNAQSAQGSVPSAHDKLAAIHKRQEQQWTVRTTIWICGPENLTGSRNIVPIRDHDWWIYVGVMGQWYPLNGESKPERGRFP